MYYPDTRDGEASDAVYWSSYPAAPPQQVWHSGLGVPQQQQPLPYLPTSYARASTAMGDPVWYAVVEQPLGINEPAL